jgi:hypothetical protein
MKIILTLVLLLTVSSIGAFAAPVACLGTAQGGDSGSMADLEANMNSVDGCYIGDKWYSDFSATGDFDADLGVYEVELNNLQNPPQPDFHGFTFLSGAGDFIGPGVYQIMYTVEVDPAFPLQFINSHSLGINVNAGLAPITYDVTGVGPVGVAVTPLSALGGVFAGGIVPATQGPITFSLNLNVGPLRTVTEFEHQIFQETQTVPPEIPEPATYLMLGSGLLALALLRRRRATR